MKERIAGKIGNANDNAFKLRKLFKMYDTDRSGKVSTQTQTQIPAARGFPRNVRDFLASKTDCLCDCSDYVNMRCFIVTTAEQGSMPVMAVQAWPGVFVADDLSLTLFRRNTGEH